MTRDYGLVVDRPSTAALYLQGINEATRGIADSLLSVVADRANEIPRTSHSAQRTRSRPPPSTSRQLAGRDSHAHSTAGARGNAIRERRLRSAAAAVAGGQRALRWCVGRARNGVNGAHEHHQYEVFIALSGEAEVEVAGEQRPFQAGDIAFPPGRVHRVINASDRDFGIYAIWWDTGMTGRFVSRQPEQG